MAKRLIALLAAVAMLFTFVACQQGGQGGSDATPTPAQGGDDATPTEGVDYTEGGKWLNIPGANDNMDWRLPAMKFKTTEVVFLNHGEIAQPDIERFSAFRDGYGLSHTTVTVGPEDRITKFVSSVMSEEAPDIFVYSFLPSMVNKGYVQPWDDYMDMSIGLWDKYRESAETLKYNGHYYSVGAQQARWDSAVFYNVSIFEELSLKSPKEYYDEGNWTWTTMRELAKQATVDADGDGTPEIYGFAADTGSCFVYSTGTAFVTFDSAAELGASNNMRSDGVARAMQFYTDLIVNDGVTLWGSDLRNEFAAGQIAMYHPDAAWYCFGWVDMMKAGTVALVPFPKDPNADAYYIKEVYGDYMMGANCKNPEGAAAYVLSAMYDQLNTNDHIEKTNEERFEAGGWSNEIDDMIQEMCYSEDKVPVQMTWITFELGEYWGDIWFGPHLGEPWSAIAEAVYPKVQDNIVRVMEG